MSTGFTPEQKAATLIRDGNLCAMIGADPRCQRRATTANHRLNRGAGGTADRGHGRNGMGNACAICDWCNGQIEDDPVLAAIARHRGVKLRDGATPALEPLWSPFFAQWVQITDHALYLLGLPDPTVRPILLPREGHDEALVAPILTPDESAPASDELRGHDRPAEGVDVHQLTESPRQSLGLD